MVGMLLALGTILLTAYLSLTMESQLEKHPQSLQFTGNRITEYQKKFCQEALLETNGTDAFLAKLLDDCKTTRKESFCAYHLDKEQLLRTWCHQRQIRSVRLLDKRRSGGLFEAGERLRVRHGGTVPLEWFHLRWATDSPQIGRNLGAISFEVLEQPKHGHLLRKQANGQTVPVLKFSYSDLLAKRILYESIDNNQEDSFKIKVDTRRVARKAAKRRANWQSDGHSTEESLNLEVDVQQPSGSAPQLTFGPSGPSIHMKPGTRLQLGEQHLRVFDTDTAADRVWLHLEEIGPGLDLLDREGMRLRRFSLAQLLAGEVQLLATDEAETMEFGTDGHATFVARDEAGEQSGPATLRVSFTPLKVVLDRNSGIRLPHHSSQLLEPSQLHFHCANFRNSAEAASLAARYSVVDQPEFGVVECLRKEKPDASSRWTLCSDFLQSDIDALSVRYRHTNANRSRGDDFDFQVHCADNSSPVQVLQIGFLPMPLPTSNFLTSSEFVTLSIRVFVQEALTLNQTDQAVLSRKNLLATVFPQNFQPDQLFFHLLEAPKLGMLLRLVPETGKQRRVGISSNFTQQQVDAGLLSYKLHFAPFSVLNDFFTFRLLTPLGGSDEVFRFDIVYLPGGGIGQLRLLNRTLVVPESGTQKISNATLWLEAADGTRNFAFHIGLAPLNGRLLLLGNEGGEHQQLDVDDVFHSEDILTQRIYYEHLGGESRWDRLFLLAESEARDPGGGKGHTPVPVFLSISIVNGNNRAPQALGILFGGALGEQNQIHLLENGERTLWPWLLPLVDLDKFEWPTTLEQSQHSFPVANWHNPLSFHVLPEPANSRDFVVCDRNAPEMPLREFGEEQLRSGQLILRHLGGARNVSMLRLTVSDGRHNTPIPLRMTASARPFLQLATPKQLQLPEVSSTDGKPAFALLTIAHLRAETNIDIPVKAIQFGFHSLLPNTPFRILSPNGTFKEVWQFSQAEILENRLFLVLDDPRNRPKAIFLKLFVDSSLASDMDAANLPEAAELIVNITFSSKIGFEKMPKSIPIFIDEGGLVLPVGGSSPIDGNLLDFLLEDERISAKFFIENPPKHGEIIFQRMRKRKEAAPSANYNIPLLSFDKSILRSGSLQYVHNNNNNGHNDEHEDEFTVIVIVEFKDSLLLKIGPFSIAVHLLAKNQLQLVVPQKPVTISNDKKMTLDENLLLLSHPNGPEESSHVEYQILSMPSSMALYHRLNGQQHFQNRFSFSQTQLIEGDILLGVNNKSAIRGRRATVTLKACDRHPRSNTKCSRPMAFSVLIEDALNLKRHKPFKTKENIVKITAEHLKVEFLDIPSNLHFLVWQQICGLLQKGFSGDNRNGLKNFTQKDVEDGNVYFKFDPGNKEEKCGFYFIYSDGQSQNGPEWFSITRELGQPTATNVLTEDDSIRVVNNRILHASPGIWTLIGSDSLSIAGKLLPNKIIYRLTRPPTHGRLHLSGRDAKIEHFTQSDIDGKRLTYQSQPNIGTWTQLDFFKFKLAISDSGKVSQLGEELTFHIENSYSNMAMADLQKLVPHNLVKVSRGGSLALNITHLNLTKLAEFSDDEIFLRLHRQPSQGWLERVDEKFEFVEFGNPVQNARRKSKITDEDELDEHLGNKWQSPLKAEQFHSGAYLVYRHFRNLTSSQSSEQFDGEDEFTLIAYGNRESSSKGLKITLKVKLIEAPMLLKVNHFPKELSLVSGGVLRLNPSILSASHSALPPSNIFYRIVQNPSNGVRLLHLTNGSSHGENAASTVAAFSQSDINEGSIALEHTPLDETRQWDLIGIQLDDGGIQKAHFLVLVFRFEPLALQMKNFTEITLQQGKTYVLLHRGFLGAESNGDRSLIIYNITKTPENGTFYWVDGEKEAISFSQNDIDKGELLYAQMNMNAYQDSFEFVLSNDEIELLPKKGIIRVVPVFQPETFSTHSRTITQLGLSQLNASSLEGTSPRYLVINGPEYGRLFLHSNSNESTTFFTHDDVLTGRLFLHTFDVPKRITENILLELRSDSVQPARIVWPIDIRPSEVTPEQPDIFMSRMMGADNFGGITKQNDRDKVIIPPPPPDMNYHFPIAILIAVVLLVIGILLCRRRSPSDDSSVSDDEEGHKKSSGADNSRVSSLKSSLKRKMNNDSGRSSSGSVKNKLLTGGYSTANASGNTAFGTGTKNLLDATVYATINYRQSKSNIFTQNGNDDDDINPTVMVSGLNSSSATFPFAAHASPLADSASFDTFQTGTFNPRRRDSSKLITISRDESKERQQLLASAISAAIASKNLDRNEENTENEKEDGSKTKNEFWV